MEDIELAGTGSGRYLRLPLLDRIPGLAHGFTVKGTDPLEAIRQAAGRPLPLATLKQVHGAAVRRLRADEPLWREEPGRPMGDALLTRRDDTAIGVATADCVSILLCDPKSRTLGAVHAGWRGTAAGVLAAAIKEIAATGAAPEDITVGLGPAIGPCCFEVGDEVIEALRRNAANVEAFVHRGHPRSRVDLVEANRRQALARGIRPDRIAAVGRCTMCEKDLLESYRRSAGAPGRMIAFAAWRDPASPEAAGPASR
ncbi:MAG TPA: peptidoglycan editing factor PgeF [Verrucomicrobiae bacterium]|nr:peptidoglycan editing factor PgeF [Verrucomicrobiae bacterium]